MFGAKLSDVGYASHECRSSLHKNSDHAVFLPRVGDFGSPALGGGLTFLL